MNEKKLTVNLALLNELEKGLNLNIFYYIHITEYEIQLQGHYHPDLEFYIKGKGFSFIKEEDEFHYYDKDGIKIVLD